MHVCYVGMYNRHAARNQILIQGLQENNVYVTECSTEHKGLKGYWEVVKKLRALGGDYDVIVVGYPAHKSVLVAKLFSRRPVVFDAFYSLYDSVVFDRQEVSPKSFQAYYYWLTDWFFCRLANRVLLDTEAHIDYFVKEFGIRREKFRCLLIGANNRVFFPTTQKQKRDYFLVHFHGSFIPLQGIEYIIDAARHLEKENIQFNIIGSGQTEREIHTYTKTLGVHNVHFLGRVPYEKINDYLNESDVSLGIFGNTSKAKRVIPNKLYEGIAARRATITGDSAAVREVFENHEHMLLCNFADGSDLAQKILELKEDVQFREKLAHGGHERYLETSTPKKIGEVFAKCLQELL